MAEQQVTLNPGESRVVSFETTPSEARTYQVTVDGLTGSFKAIEVTPALFVYASDVRQTPWTPYPQYPARTGMKYEVDIQNIGGVAGSCTAVGHVDATAQKNTFSMGTQVINPGQVATFKGQWEWGFVPEEDDWWFKDGGYIVSEAGCISFKFGRSVYLVSFDIPSQIPSGGEFWPTQVVHLAGGGDGELFMVWLELRGPQSSYVSRATIHALYPGAYAGDTWFALGNVKLLSIASDYTIRGTYGQELYAGSDGAPNLPCKATYPGFRIYNPWLPLPPGVYDVISSLYWSTQAAGYAPGHRRPIWSIKVGQVQVI